MARIQTALPATAAAALVLLLVAAAPPAGGATINITVDASKPINRVLAEYLSFNIDLSSNRGFFWRKLSGTPLVYLADQLTHSYANSFLRVGGTGGDFLTYAVGGNASGPGAATRVGRGDQHVMNTSLWENLAGFSTGAQLRMVFGLNIMKRTADGKAWDPTNARSFIQYLIKTNFTMFGFELGNEQNGALTPETAAADFLILQGLLVELYPDAATRPKLFGPDPHSFKGVPPSTSLLQYLAAFLTATKKLGVDIFAITHHEYIEVEVDTDTNPKTLDMTSTIAKAVNATVHGIDPSINLLLGEGGPHNGGSPPCDHTSMRWANFGNSLWYADALGAKAANGYQGFCRQDFIGADYGLVDCSTGAPLPDYYVALIWQKTMGKQVLRARSSDPTGSVRAYAHCFGGLNSASVVLINLGAEPATVSTPLDGATRAEYRLTPTAAGGLNGTGVALNGHELVMAHGRLPLVLPRNADNTPTITLDPTSVTFVVFPQADAAACTTP